MSAPSTPIIFAIYSGIALQFMSQDWTRRILRTLFPFQQQMDTVVCLNVLEHIEDDGATLRSLMTLLESGGRLILLVPNDPRAYGTVDKEIGHFRRYTPDQLGSLMTDSGFEMGRILKFNRVSMPAWRISGQILKSRALSRSALSAFDRLVWLWRKIDGSLPWQPTSIIAIARRPG